jgi:hypothetical protein
MGKKIIGKCCACEKTEELRNIDGEIYCAKHAYQVKRHGKTFERTRFDPNEIVIYENYAEIIVYDKFGNERDRTKIDLEDVKKCKLHKWHKKESVHGKEYLFTRINGTPIRLHRYVLDFYEKNLEVDHKDGDSLNNQKYNLAIVTHRQNMLNQRKLPSNNITGYMGVHLHTQNKNWVAVIKVDGKNIHLGSFQTIEEAIECRHQAELKYFGEYKLSNFENKDSHKCL